MQALLCAVRWRGAGAAASVRRVSRGEGRRASCAAARERRHIAAAPRRRAARGTPAAPHASAPGAQARARKPGARGGAQLAVRR
jgi:hypothetical protein